MGVVHISLPCVFTSIAVRDGGSKVLLSRRVRLYERLFKRYLDMITLQMRTEARYLLLFLFVRAVPFIARDHALVKELC